MITDLDQRQKSNERLRIQIICQSLFQRTFHNNNNNVNSISFELKIQTFIKCCFLEDYLFLPELGKLCSKSFLAFHRQLSNETVVLDRFRH